ncbi:MAG: hypothetical protein WCF38_06805, partial [Pseudolabrys sp.]
PKVRNPWSAERLIRLSKSWDFSTKELDELDMQRDFGGDPEPISARASRRIHAAMEAWLVFRY